MWSAVAFMVLAFPAYTQVGRSLSSRISGVPLREHVLAERDTLITSGRQALLSTVFLLHQTWVMLDAIGRTLVRMLFTRRRLLEWVTADRASRVQTSAAAAMWSMILAPATALVIAVFVGAAAPTRLPLALFVLSLWFLSPAIAYATGQPVRHRHVPLDRAARTMLRCTARRTWRFFDDLAGPADNWLIPDNVQEDRRERIAHRTSPTNIGLQLLSTLAARDFGYLTTSELVSRLEPTFETLLRMPRYRGHFYNWYDTTTLAPLPPAYISTVDSGNLAGYFMTLGSGLAGIANRPLIDVTFLDGVCDTLELCEAELGRAAARRTGSSDRAIRRELAKLRSELGATPSTVAGWNAMLLRIRDRLSEIGVLLHELEEPDLSGQTAPTVDRTGRAGALAEAAYWHGRAVAAVAAQQHDLRELTAWLEMPGPAGVRRPPLVPTLGELVDWCDESLRTLTDKEGFDGLRDALERACAFGEDLTERAARLRVLVDDLVDETEFGFLFNRDRQLFSIGFSVADGRLDPSHYDTLASEARLASFVAIATGAIPHEHWFKLGRSLTPTGTSRALLSWSASMFEYLMPALVMRAYPNTLLDETYEAIVNRQMKYGSSRGVPWGISESAYNVQDLEGNYQYRAFGVPGLGLKRGLADDLVVAPYATILAALVSPADAVANLEENSTPRA